MKSRILPLLGLAILLSSCGGNREISQFYHKHKRGKDVTNFTVPGWLIWFGTGLANEFVKKPDEKAALRIAKEIKQIRLLVAEDQQVIPEAEVTQLISNLKKDNFEDLIYVKDGETQFSMMIREKNKRIKNLFILVNDKGDLVMISLKANLHYNEINRLVKSFGKKLKLEKPLKKPLPQA